MENEFLPLISGVIAGLLLGGVTARRRPMVWALLSVGLGLLATVATGEFKATWAYLLVDIPLVGAASSATFLAARHVRRRQLQLG